MIYKRNFKTSILIQLRRVGWLCKKAPASLGRIRISKTFNPDGSVTIHDKIYKQPLYQSNTFEMELHIWNEIHNIKNKQVK